MPDIKKPTAIFLLLMMLLTLVMTGHYAYYRWENEQARLKILYLELDEADVHYQYMQAYYETELKKLRPIEINNEIAEVTDD